MQDTQGGEEACSVRRRACSLAAPLCATFQMLSTLSFLTVAGVSLTSTQSVLLLLPLLYVLYCVYLHSGYSRNNPIVWSWVPHLRRYVPDCCSLLAEHSAVDAL